MSDKVPKLMKGFERKLGPTESVPTPQFSTSGHREALKVAYHRRVSQRPFETGRQNESEQRRRTLVCKSLHRPTV